MVDHESIPMNRPDPRPAQTAKELGQLLAQLRSTAPRADLEQNPPTIRDLEAATGVPRSTLSSAENGTSLPSAKVVSRFAAACGVPGGELATWVQARDRIARYDRVRRRQLKLAAVAPAADDAQQVPEPDEHRPARVATEFLRSRSVAVRDGELDRALEALPVTVCAEYLTLMDRDAAAECLSLLSPAKGMECLLRLDAGVAAGLLWREAPVIAVEHLQLLPAPESRRFLQRLPSIVAARMLHSMPRATATRLLEAMPADWIRALIANRRVPSSLAADLVFTIGYRQSVVLLAALPQPRLVALLAAMDHEPAAGAITALEPARIRKVFAILQDGRVARILAHLGEADAAEVLAGMPARRAARIAAEFPPGQAAGILHRVPDDRRRLIVAAIPGDARARLQLEVNRLIGRDRWPSSGRGVRA